jgi:hypothetical protein
MSGTGPRLDDYERDLIAEVRKLAADALASPDASAELIHMASVAARVADIAARLAACDTDGQERSGNA